MPRANTCLEGVVRRFASRAARFRLALGLGFVIAAAGVASIAVNEGDGFADTIWGFTDFFGSQQPADPQSAASGGWSGWIAAHRPRARREAARRRVAHVESARFVRSVEHSDGPDDGPVNLGRRSVCVRLCDGFAFPVGIYHGEADRASHEATCRSECPGAATALYVEPAGSDTLDEAVRVGSGRTYSELPYAFHYTTVLSDACTCHPPEGNRIKSLLHDFTLRRGDAVMTANGVKVFHGATRFPYRRADFLTLARSHDIRGTDRANFRAIERASLMSSPNVVAQVVPAPAPVAGDVTHGLEHQASLVGPLASPISALATTSVSVDLPLPPARPRQP